MHSLAEFNGLCFIFARVPYGSIVSVQKPFVIINIVVLRVAVNSSQLARLHVEALGIGLVESVCQAMLDELQAVAVAAVALLPASLIICVE